MSSSDEDDEIARLAAIQRGFAFRRTLWLALGAFAVAVGGGVVWAYGAYLEALQANSEVWFELPTRYMVIGAGLGAGGLLIALMAVAVAFWARSRRTL